MINTKTVVNIGYILSIPWFIFLNFIRWPNCHIYYKSGNYKKVFLLKMNINTDGSKIFQASWESVVEKPLYLNVDEIESVWWTR